MSLEPITSHLQHYMSAFFLIGLLVVAAYALQRFNQPSFPNQETLPRTVEPVRYLFLRRAYRRALFTYVTVSLLLYGVLVLPGPKMVQILAPVGVKDFPAEGWALLVALFLVGIVPNSNMKWLTMVEEQLRRLVHAWFLVPDGVVRTIGLLEDARYEPLASQFDVLPVPVRNKLREDLRLPTTSLRYRWARAAMLMASLKQMGTGAAHPLKREAFEPFQEDFDSIKARYKALAQDVAELEKDAKGEETEESLTQAIESLLKRIYAYISWGVRHQADSEQEVDRTLEDLGFRVPNRGEHRLFDLVIPAVLYTAGITMVFWLGVDTVSRLLGAPAPTLDQSVVYALNSAVAAGLMYGGAIAIALNRRYAKIEQKVWRQGSPKCLVPIAFWSGLTTWAVIILSTVVGEILGKLQSQASVNLAETIQGLAGKALTALPWLLAGAMASALLADRLGGDVRRTDRKSRVHDALVLGGGLGLAVAAAYLMQISLKSVLLSEKAAAFGYVPMVGLAGFACGAVIGFVVPNAFRAHLVKPYDLTMARALRDLLRHAEVVLGSKDSAADWVFTPHREFGGVTPAEATQHKAYATGVLRHLDREAASQRDEARPDPNDRLIPVVIEGGLSSG
jgi:hypothetical protein